MNNTIPKTFNEACLMGWVIYDVCYTKGYLSRKTCNAEQPILKAEGSRRNEYYFESPCFNSTRFHYRNYMKPRYQCSILD